MDLRFSCRDQIRGGLQSEISTSVGITGGARRCCSMRIISACVLRYVSVAAAVSARTGRRLRGGAMLARWV